MRKNVSVTIFDGDEYATDWPPTNAIECVAWFSRKLESIPHEYRDAASINIASVSGRDYSYSHYVRIDIWYRRPETDEELAVLEEKELRKQEAHKALDLKTLAELKAKYG